MGTAQPGIFALGTASHAYLELDAAAVRRAGISSTAIASLREPRTTMGGVNLVAGFRPELWRRSRPATRRPGCRLRRRSRRGRRLRRCRRRSTTPCSGSRAAPTTSSSTSRAPRSRRSRGVAVVAEETSSWPYRHDLDLTGFIDGTENPTLVEAPEVVLVPDGRARARAARSCCCRSGRTTLPRGRRCPSPSRSA